MIKPECVDPEPAALPARRSRISAGVMAAAGAGNVGKDQPNAALSVDEPDRPDSTVAIIEILHPGIEGDDTEYAYKRIEGQLQRFGGQTALFLDWIGVGVGLRGPGSSMTPSPA